MDSKRHFQLVQETTVPELQAQVFRYRHLKTGAEVLSVVCDDDNKVFGITFKTPPPDSSGIAHIMEHAVLCGSRKYPVKEPFVELLKGSLKTFLNAMTYADKTVYPVASANLKDFYNLMDVYLDAVFFPKISPEILQQEGWHYDVSPDSGSLKFKGVVYNEMKGAYASPGRAISRTSIRAVFPDTIYAHDSGGDPEEIPTLSYQNFRKFHEEFYHPSNARFFFYGDDDPGQRLVRLSEYLETFSARNINSDIVLQAPFMAPRRLEERYLTGDGGHGPQGAVTVNWGFPEIVGTEARLRLSILNYLLLGTPTAPLRKKLIDSGLGADLSGGGFHTGLRQPFFSTGLKGIDPQLADRIEELILVELERLSREGFARDSVEAALNAYEFNYRENNTGAYPRGLSLMLRALSGWLHNDNPIEPLFYEKPLTHLRTQLLGNPEIFGVLIRELFLENSHRATVVFKPDPNMAREREDLEKEKLEKTFATLSTGEIETLAAQARDLRILQSTPDSPENLAAIPSLTRGDLDPKHRAIPNTVNRIGTNTALFHDLFTGGIVYLKVAFPINGLPGHLLPYLRLFGRFLLEAGTHTSTPQQITERIDRYTGGIWRSNLTLADETGRASSWLTFNAKCLHQRIPEMMELLAEILREARLDNKARFRQIVLDVKSSQENSLSAAGHRLALRRLAAGRHQSAWLREAMGGIEHLFFLRELVERIDRDWQGVETDLRAIRDWVIQREGVLFNVTGEEEAWNLLEPHLSAFLEKFGARIGQGESWQESLGIGNEALVIPSQVNCVIKGGTLYDLGYRFHGSIMVINKFLRTNYLWDRVRVQGGAYGASCSFSRRTGLYSFSSYRDPNLSETLSVYSEAASFLQNLDISPLELERSIIGAIGAIDGYQLPDAKGETALVRYLTGDGDDLLQEIRSEVLETRLSHFHELGEVLAELDKNATVIVAGPADRLEHRNGEPLPEWDRIIKVM